MNVKYFTFTIKKFELKLIIITDYLKNNNEYSQPNTAPANVYLDFGRPDHCSAAHSNDKLEHARSSFVILKLCFSKMEFARAIFAIKVSKSKYFNLTSAVSIKLQKFILF